MRKLIARVFDYSLDGRACDAEGTKFFQFCRNLPDDPAQTVETSEFFAGADLQIMGRVHYQDMAGYFRPPPTTRSPSCSTPRAR